MKKLVFTALAVVAFSGVAMAKTNNLIKTNVIKSQDEVLAQNDCNLAKFVAYTDSRNAGFNHADSVGNSYSVYFLCLSLPQEVTILEFISE